MEKKINCQLPSASPQWVRGVKEYSIISVDIEKLCNSYIQGFWKEDRKNILEHSSSILEMSDRLIQLDLNIPNMNEIQSPPFSLLNYVQQCLNTLHDNELKTF